MSGARHGKCGKHCFQISPKWRLKCREIRIQREVRNALRTRESFYILPTVKIVSWNVNGLRACARNHFRDWFARSDADIVLIQELRAEPQQLDADLVEMPGYQSFFLPAQKKGYAGVAAWVRDSLGPSEFTPGLGMEDVDREGRVVTVSVGELRVVGSYVPNGGKSPEAFNMKLAYWDRVREWHREMVAKGLSVAFLGDFNICHEPIDIADPVGNRNSIGFLPVERQKLSEYFDAGFADCFRRFHPGEGNHYTWWSNRPGVRERNHGWRIDYATVDESLWPRVRRCWHDTGQFGSDHCPIGLELR